MKDNIIQAQQLYGHANIKSEILNDPNVAHVTINNNKVIGLNAVPGLIVDINELKDGIEADVRVKKNTVIKKTVHLCFGMLPEKGVQRIVMRVNIEENAKISILAHCIFPNAVDITHIMDAKINIGNNAEYSYFEKHVHGGKGGIKVYPKAIVNLGENARFKTEFELLHGRVGFIEIDYETECLKNSVMEMTARINGLSNDIIKIKEVGHLIGDGSRGVLTSKIAVRNNARAQIYNKLTASGVYARGHVDCKEIVQDNAIATATPIVEVNNPKAHITHEAAIGSVDSKQLETLMSRGLSEDEAVELIIRGLLS